MADDIVVEDLEAGQEDAKQAPSGTGLFSALGGDADEGKATPKKDGKTLKRKATKPKNKNKTLRRKNTGENSPPPGSKQASGPTQSDVPEDEETKEHSPRGGKSKGGDGAEEEQEKKDASSGDEGGGGGGDTVETGNAGEEDAAAAAGGARQSGSKRGKGSDTVVKTKSGRTVKNPDRKSLIPKGGNSASASASAGGGGGGGGGGGEEEEEGSHVTPDGHRKSSCKIEVPLFVEATKHTLERRNTWNAERAAELKNRPKNRTVDYLLHAAAMLVFFAAVTSHGLLYSDYAWQRGRSAGDRNGAAGTHHDGLAQAMFACVCAPHLLTALLLARKAFSFPWCVLVLFLWAALPIAAVVLMIYEFERLSMMAGGRHANETFRAKSSFTAISGIPVHEYEALRNVCLAVCGDLPMLALAALGGGFGSADTHFARSGIAAFALGASGAHLLCTCVQVWAQARPLFSLTATGQRRIGVCRYTLFALGLARPDDRLAEAFGRLLKNGTYTCAVLKLSGGGITDEGVEHLAKGLESKQCATLLRLDLGDNCVSTDGAERLATALETNHTVKEIDLYNQTAENNTPLPRMIYEQVAVRTDYRITIDFSSQVKLY